MNNIKLKYRAGNKASKIRNLQHFRKKNKQVCIFVKIFQSFDLDHYKIFQWNPCQIHTSSWQWLVGEIFTLKARVHSAFFEKIPFLGMTPIFMLVKSLVASDRPKEKLGGINFRVPYAINIRKQKGNFFVANDQELTNNVFCLSMLTSRLPTPAI